MADPNIEAIKAQLPAVDPPSPRQQRVAAGLALIRQGYDYRKAAEAVGIPKSTLWAADHGLRPTSGRSESMGAIEEHIEDLSAQITARAAESILERLEDGSMRPSEVIKAHEVARNTLAMRRGWDRSQIGDTRAVSALADALEAMRDKVRADAKVAEAIEVEPTE